MTYKISIDVKYESPKKYQRLLTPHETISGKSAKFSFTLTNLGNQMFPGGHAQIGFQTPSGIQSIFISPSAIPIPSIKPKESASMVRILENLFPGVWLIKIDMTSKDKKKIEHFLRKEPVEDGFCFDVFYVVDRHMIEMFLLLKSSTQKGK